MNKYLLVLFCLLPVSCNNINYSKDNHIKTSGIRDNLFVETYRIYSGGVTGGDVETVYLTDSVSFRKYVGKKMDYELIYAFVFQEKNVLVSKINAETYRVIDSKVYKTDQLREEGKFE